MFPSLQLAGLGASSVPFFLNLFLHSGNDISLELSVRGNPSHQLTPCISCFCPIKMPKQLFHVGTPFLGLEENPEAISSPRPLAELGKPHPKAASNTTVSGSSGQTPGALGQAGYPTIPPPPTPTTTTSSPPASPPRTVPHVEFRVRRARVVYLPSCVILDKLVQLSEPLRKD